MIFPLIGIAFTAIASAVTSIGPAVAGFCSNVLPKIAPLLEKGLEILRVVEGIANTVSQAIGIFKSNETAEIIGDRAIQAADMNITPDLFENHDEYMTALRDFELDPEKSAKLSNAQKIVSGLAVAGRGLDEKFGNPEGTTGNLWWLAAAKPEYFVADKLTQFLKTGQDIISIVDYFEGKLGGGESVEIEDTLVNLDKKMTPDAEEKSIRGRIYEAANAVQEKGR
jgi:hypothetical protein